MDKGMKSLTSDSDIRGTRSCSLPLRGGLNGFSRVNVVIGESLKDNVTLEPVFSEAMVW